MVNVNRLHGRALMPRSVSTRGRAAPYVLAAMSLVGADLAVATSHMNEPVKAVIEGKWVKSCPLRIPDKWMKEQTGPEEDYVVLPKPGFALGDFEFQATWMEMSQAEFVVAYSVKWADLGPMGLPSDFAQAEYDELAQVRREFPSATGTISHEASEAIFQGQPLNELKKNLAQTKVGSFTARRKLNLEDGAVINAVPLNVYRSDDKLNASLSVLASVPSQPQWEQHKAATSFTCTAESGFGVSAFSRMCAAFLEQQLLSPPKCE